MYGHSVFIDDLSLHFFISFFTLAFLFLSKLGVFLQKLVAFLIPCGFLLLILCFKLFSFLLDSLFFEIFFLFLSFEFIFFSQFLFFHLLLQMLLQQFLFLLFFVKLLIWVCEASLLLGWLRWLVLWWWSKLLSLRGWGILLR